MKRVISTESRVFSLFRRGGSAARIRALEEQNRVQAATIDQHVATIKQINEKLHALSTRAEAEAERDYQLVMAQQNLMAELKDLDAGFAPVFESCRRFTMTSIERLYALYKAVEYVARARIAGDLVETGVWRGGSMMLVAKTLLSLEDAGRRLYLYDTYEGHPKPDAERDVDLWGNVAHSEWIKHRITDSTSDWAKV